MCHSLRPPPRPPGRACRHITCPPTQLLSSITQEANTASLMRTTPFRPAGYRVQACPAPAAVPAAGHNGQAHTAPHSSVGFGSPRTPMQESLVHTHSHHTHTHGHSHTHTHTRPAACLRVRVNSNNQSHHTGQQMNTKAARTALQYMTCLPRPAPPPLTLAPPHPMPVLHVHAGATRTWKHTLARRAASCLRPTRTCSSTPRTCWSAPARCT